MKKLITMTIIVMASIVGIIVMARLTLRDGGYSQRVFKKAGDTPIREEGLTSEEEEILLQLQDMLEIGQVPAPETMTGMYYYYLKQYFLREDVRLDKDTMERIRGELRHAKELTLLEKNADPGKMSCDGRTVARFLYMDIYRLSGLRIRINSEGEIEEIAKPSGELIFEKKFPEAPGSLHFEVAGVVLMVLGVLFLICLLTYKKGQIFEKGGDCREYNAKRIA
ncbi:MAG TPA: hypothetical protein GXX75_09880 [Clostridiales bacterium]|nr:hypothetical protein [Clostridiales bacterium]